MTTQDKPAVGPLSASDVKLLVKGDLLRVRSYADQVRLCRFLDSTDDQAPVLRVEEDGLTAPNCWGFHRFAFIGRPGPDGWVKAPEGGWKENPVPGQMVLTRTRRATAPEPVKSEWIDWSIIIAFRLAPTAAVEAGGSERDISGETFLGFRVAAWRYRQGDETEKLPHHYAEHWSTPGGSAWGVQRLFTEEQLQQALNLRPQPSGETREAVARVEAMLPAIERIFPVHVTETPDYAELAFHECAAQAMTMEPDTWAALNTLATDLRALLLPAEQGGGDDLRAACQAILDDHQTSETHHPGHILIRRADFERIAALIRPAIPASEGGEG